MLASRSGIDVGFQCRVGRSGQSPLIALRSSRLLGMQLQLEALVRGATKVGCFGREGAERHSPINAVRRQVLRSVPQPLNPAPARAPGLAATDISVPPIVVSTGTPHLLIGEDYGGGASRETGGVHRQKVSEVARHITMVDSSRPGTDRCLLSRCS